MIGPWAASLPSDRSAEAVRLWKSPGVEVCAGLERLWLRGQLWSEALDTELRLMLGCERFAADAEGLITPCGAALPVERLPDGPWRPLTEWFRLAAPPRSFAAQT